jgi:hypothetical protein
MATHERKLGRRDGIRYAITWLHKRAEGMNDPNARQVLNSAATNLGWDLDRSETIPCERSEA